MKAKELRKKAEEAQKDKSDLNNPLAEEQYKHLIDIFTELAADGITQFSFKNYNYAGFHYSYYQLREISPTSMFGLLLEKLKNEGFTIVAPTQVGALLGNQPDPAHEIRW
jgi:hypothetical protein